MADINSSDQALNELKIKTDALPNDWYVTLVNPKNGEPGENMTIARFVELFLKNNKIWTANNDGSGSGLDADTSSVLEINNVEDKTKGRLQFFQKQRDSVLNPTVGWCSLIRMQHPGYSNGYWQELAFPFTSNEIFYRRNLLGEYTNWKKIAFVDTAKYASEPNVLTETIVEEVPVSADTPMTLEETGQPAPAMQTVEHYEYSIRKMAEAILALQKEIAELKGGAGKE